jgi:hypothetical protein
MLSEAYGGEAMKKTSVFEWYNRFKESSLVENHKRRQCSSLSSISRVLFTFEFIPQGQTVNQAYYVELLKWLREAVRIKRPELWNSY